MKPILNQIVRFSSIEHDSCDNEKDVGAENNYYNNIITFCKYTTDQQFDLSIYNEVRKFFLHFNV